MRYTLLIFLTLSFLYVDLSGQGMGAGEEEFNFSPEALKSKGYVQCKIYTSTQSEQQHLDSFNVKKIFDFDTEGNIIKETNYESKIQYKNLYLKDKLKETQVIALGNSLIERVIFTYNKKGFPTEIVTKNDKGKESSKVVSIYKKKKILKEEIYYIDKVERTHWKYFYNKNNQLIERKTFTDGYFKGVWKYVYDNNGNLTVFTIFNNENKLITKHVRKYNSNNQIVKIEVYSDKNQLISVLNAKYDDSGLLKEREYIYNIFNNNLNEADKEIEKYKYYKNRGN